MDASLHSANLLYAMFEAGPYRTAPTQLRIFFETGSTSKHCMACLAEITKGPWPNTVIAARRSQDGKLGVMVTLGFPSRFSDDTEVHVNIVQWNVQESIDVDHGLPVSLP
ncbi:MAG: hypothetical protein R6X02_14245 [Enhygromyxa sp.]